MTTYTILTLMINKESQELIDEITENKTKYANTIDKIKFIMENIKLVPVERILYLDRNVDRSKVISEFATLLVNIDLALKLEAGIFEFTLIYSITKDYLDMIMPSIYNDKVYDLLQNLNPAKPMHNKTLWKLIYSDKINPQTVAFLSPQELHPEQWSGLIKKAKLREEKRKNFAVTDLYECRKCKERKCTVTEAQTRSLDEGVTKWISCTVCHHVMKK